MRTRLHVRALVLTLWVTLERSTCVCVVVAAGILARGQGGNTTTRVIVRVIFAGALGVMLWQGVERSIALPNAPGAAIGVSIAPAAHGA